MKTRLTRKVADGYITKVWEVNHIIKKLAKQAILENIEQAGTFNEFRYLLEIQEGAFKIEKLLINMQYEEDKL